MGIVTVLGAIIALILDILDYLTLTTAENIIIALLALLAIDALVERLEILERLEKKIDKHKNIYFLRKRSDIIPINELTRHATEINILAVSGVSIVNPYQYHYENKLRDGCNIRFILLSSESKYIDAFNLQNKENIIARDHIKPALNILFPLAKNRKLKGRCDVRLLDIFLPFSLVGIDFEKRTGKMIVEFHNYKTYLDKRPHVLIERETNPHWFNIYKEQFEMAWKDAKKL